MPRVQSNDAFATNTEMMQRWADCLEELRGSSLNYNVLESKAKVGGVEFAVDKNEPNGNWKISIQ